MVIIKLTVELIINQPPVFAEATLCLFWSLIVVDENWWLYFIQCSPVIADEKTVFLFNGHL